MRIFSKYYKKLSAWADRSVWLRPAAVLFFMAGSVGALWVIRPSLSKFNLDSNASGNSSRTISQANSVRQDIELKPVADSPANQTASSGSGDVLGLGISPVHDACGGKSIGIDSFKSAIQTMIDLAPGASTPVEEEGDDSGAGGGLFSFIRDCEVKVRTVRIPLYWEGVDNKENGLLIEPFKFGEAPSISKYACFGANTAYAEYDSENDEFNLAVDTSRCGTELMTPELSAKGYSQVGVEPTGMKISVGVDGGGGGGVEELSSGEWGTHTHGCEGDGRWDKMGMTGCESATGVHGDSARSMTSLYYVPFSSEPNNFARPSDGNRPEIMPAAIVPGRIECLNDYGIVTGSTVRLSGIYRADSALKDVKVVLYFENILGDNHGAPPFSSEVATDAKITGKRNPASDEVQQLNDGTVSGPYVEDRYIATECEVTICGKVVGAYCIFKDYLDEIFKGDLTSAEYIKHCMLSNSPYCDSEDYYKYVYEYHGEGD